MGYVAYQFGTGMVQPGAVFDIEVLADDAFGGIFAIAMLLVAVFSVAGSISYMREQRYPAVYYSLILLSAIGMVLVAYSTDSGDALRGVGADEHTHVRAGPAS